MMHLIFQDANAAPWRRDAHRHGNPLAAERGEGRGGRRARWIPCGIAWNAPAKVRAKPRIVKPWRPRRLADCCDPGPRGRRPGLVNECDLRNGAPDMRAIRCVMQSAQQLVMHDTLVLLCGTMLVAGAASCGGSDGSTGGTTTSPNGKSVSSVSISPPSASMAVGTTVTFAVTVAANGGASTAVTWVTSNSSVATVAPSGDATAVVTAVGPGTATISAISSFDATKQGTAAITVVAGVRSVNITPATLTLQKGRTAKFSATVSADAGVVTGVTWTSSNTGVATIGTDGTLTAVGNGTATITAKSTADASKTATAAITIIDPCSGTTNLTIPSTVNPALSTTSCFA